MTDADLPTPHRMEYSQGRSIGPTTLPTKHLSPPVWEEKHLRFATDAAGIGLSSWHVDTDTMTMDQRGFDIWGMQRHGGVTFTELSKRIHPQDMDRVRAAFSATRAISGSYEIDFRLVLDGDELRWVSARGQGDEEALVGRVAFGVFLDVTQRKQAEEAQGLLAGEMSHRVHNLLAIAAALTRISAHSSTTAAEMAGDLSRRLAALGRAHGLVRPNRGEEKQALLGDLLTILLAPYDDPELDQPRIRIAVPRMVVGEAAATTLALVVHELATNSLKYGALSIEAGMLDVSCAAEGEDMVLVWTETGGPPVVAPRPHGFGSTMVTRGMARQLSGEIAFDWKESGLVVTLRIRKARLAV